MIISLRKGLGLEASLLATHSLRRSVAAPFPPPDIPNLLERRSDDCGFAGNPDLYGLGIRLGVYFNRSPPS